MFCFIDEHTLLTNIYIASLQIYFTTSLFQVLLKNENSFALYHNATCLLALCFLLVKSCVRISPFVLVL